MGRLRYFIEHLLFHAQWAEDIPEVKEDGSSPAVILVGSKSDLRKAQHSPEDEPLITQEEAEACRKSIHARKYVECSAKEDQNIRELFQAAIEAHLKPKRKPGCLLGGCFGL